MTLRIAIDRDLCMGSGNCVFEAPGVFALDDDQIAIVVDPTAAPLAKVVEAARKCPARAITVHEGGSDG
jgi:ferredoxin